MAAEVVSVLADVYKQILEDELDFAYAVLTGDVEEINRLGEDYRFVAELAVEILDAVREELMNASAGDLGYAAGWLTGRIAGEIVVEVVPAVLTAGASAGATLGTRAATIAAAIPRMANKLSNLSVNLPTVPGLSPQIVQNIATKLLLMLGYVEDMANTKMCFVAGTLVHTSQGLSPIETIEQGDLVWSRDENTGTMAYKPVIRAFVTHPNELVHVTYRISPLAIAAATSIASGHNAYDTLTGTGEHPFFRLGDDRFVPMRELQIGDVLLLADGTKTAYVTDIQVQRGPPADQTENAIFGWDGDAYTTYNFEVADYHTYFVGESGAWVHNAGNTPCQRIFAISERIERTTGKTGVEKIKETLDLTNTPGRRNAVDMTLRNFFSEVMREIYNGATSLSDVPTVQQLKNLKNTTAYGDRLKNKNLDVHHTTPTYLLTRLMKLAHDDWTDAQILDAVDAIKDQMPGLLLYKKDHVGIDAEGIASFHRRLSQDAGLPAPAAGGFDPGIASVNLPYTRDEILSGMKSTYEGWGRPSVWEATKIWLQQAGIDTAGY